MDRRRSRSREAGGGDGGVGGGDGAGEGAMRGGGAGWRGGGGAAAGDAAIRGGSGGGWRGEGAARRGSRSRSPHRSRSRSPRRRGSPYRGSRRGSRSRSRSRSPRRAPPPPRRTAAEEEEYSLTRDARTVFISGLVARADERDVREFFKAVGHVVSVSLIRDRSSGRSKGMGYVEFDSLDVLPQALLLDGTKFCMKHHACVCSGFPLAVKPTGVERNYAAKAEAAGGSALTADAARKVYVLNLPPSTTEADLRALGAVVGPVERAMLLKVPGAGYLMYRDVSQVATALAKLNNLALGSAVLKAGQVDTVGNVVTVTGECIPLQGGGEGLTPQARAALMATLSSGVNAKKTQLFQGLTAAVAAGAGAAAAGFPQPLPTGALPSPPMPPLPPPPEAPLPTPCVLLSNVFSPAEETEVGWEAEVRDSIVEEAGKQGGVVFAHLDPRDPRGLVFLMMRDLESAARVQGALGGRKFGARVVATEPMPLEAFISLFPASALAMQQALAAGQ